MKERTRKRVASFYSFLDRFIPERLARGDREEYLKARFFMTISAVAIFLGVAFAIYYFATVQLRLGIICTTIVFVYATNFVVLRATQSLQTTVNWAFFAATCCLAYTTWWTGGNESPSVIWHVTLPCWAFVFAPFSTAVFWSVVNGGWLLGLQVLNTTGFEFPDARDPAQADWLRTLQNLGGIGVLIISIYLYEAFKAESLSEMQKMNRELLEARNAMQQVNATLENRVSERTEELEAAMASLKDLSTIDALTGVRQRGYFEEVFSQEWQRATRSKTPLAVLMIDLDYFKSINDTHGHQAGDECLQHAAKKISVCASRTQDTVARYGGEEFVVLMPCTDLQGALHVAKKLHGEIEELRVDFGGKQLTFTISIGVASLVPLHKLDPEKLISLADAALYRAKDDGRNRVRAYEDDSTPPPAS